MATNLRRESTIVSGYAVASPTYTLTILKKLYQTIYLAEDVAQEFGKPLESWMTVVNDSKRWANMFACDLQKLVWEAR